MSDSTEPRTVETFEDCVPIIRELKDQPLAAITSILYQRGFSGIKYFELRSLVFKELQRIDSEEKRKTFKP